MSSTHARCTNMIYCSKAETRQDIEIPAGAPMLCPECGKPLSVPGAKAPSGLPLSTMVLGGGFLLMALAGGLTAYTFLGRHSAPTATPAAAPAAPARPAGSGDEMVLLRLRGDTALGGALAADLAQGFLRFSGDEQLQVAPPANGVVKISGKRSGHTEIITLATSNNEDGLAALARGDADIAITTRPISAGEKAGLAGLGDMSSAAAEHVIAAEGMVVVVNPANDISAISADQLRAVMNGSIKDWGDLGGNSADLHLIGASKDGSLTPAANGRDAVAAVLKDPGALALVAQADAGTAKVLALSVNGSPVTISAASIASGDYPLVRRLYLYTAPNGANVLTQRFAAYAASGAGQKSVVQAGFVAVAPAPTAVAANAAIPGNAQSTLAGLRKINFEIHFNPNSTVPDIRAIRFIDSLYNILVSEHTQPGKMILAGFADSQGTEQSNIEVARKRADAIAAILTARGMKPGKVESFGSQNPIASNSTEDGREANRRVEIYLMP